MTPAQTAYFELAKRYFNADQFEEALATLRYLFTLHGADPEVDRLLAAAAHKCDDEDTAVAAYERALPHFPKDIYLRVGLAELYIARVRATDAARLLKEAMELDPDIKTPAGMRARVLVMKAKKHFSQM